MSDTTTDWQALGEPSPDSLVPARVELHFAAQVPAAAARGLLPAVADDSHTALAWLARSRVLAGATTPSGLRAALRPADLTLLAIDAGETAVAELALAGRTLAEALVWMAVALRAPAGSVLAPPPYEMPEHALAHGGVFSSAGDDRALPELARWYAVADESLRALAARTPGASPVRCWPHHFDIATLLPGRAGGTIGVGLSPGDGSYAEPYWYVTPWPYPRDPAPAVLPAGGAWHSLGWFGAVLTAGAALAPRDPDARADRVSAFVSGAIAAIEALGASPA